MSRFDLIAPFPVDKGSTLKDWTPRSSQELTPSRGLAPGLRWGESQSEKEDGHAEEERSEVRGDEVREIAAREARREGRVEGRPRRGRVDGLADRKENAQAHPGVRRRGRRIGSDV